MTAVSALEPTGPAAEGADAAPVDDRMLALTALEAEFGELITHFRRRIAANAERLSPGMLPSAYKTFTTIARCETTSASRLAEILLMDKGQLSRTLRELEELGLIARRPDPEDRRATLLSPTPEGRERLAHARRPQEGILMTALSEWEVDDIHTLTVLLKRLTAASREV